ncbi:class A beta-lactamase-related serine hydrolase [Mycobacterium sp. NBC_00419]|uniref:hypothetical protein n=1 Tax=Mycobacterium sp. NBC_00419 TaxID=2975989 RepID=UPI002E21D9A8
MAAVLALLIAGVPWFMHRLGTDRAAADPRAPTPTAEQTSQFTPSAVPSQSSDAVDLSAAFAELSTGLSADIGLAYAPVGAEGRVTTLGTWSSGPAWSTIKVPLALALLRQDGTQSVSGAMRSAITASDNGAAQSMWDELGAHQGAADKVQSILAEAGDPTPLVPSEVTRPGFSAFGQTLWPLSDQVRFLARAACDPRDAPVLDLMGEVVSGQRWGLGTIDGSRFKGGWGPGTDGLYLVRQYGIVDTPEGHTVVALAAVPDSGGFGDGTAVLNRMAAWLQEHLGEIGGGRCGS